MRPRKIRLDDRTRLLLLIAFATALSLTAVLLSVVRGARESHTPAADKTAQAPSGREPIKVTQFRSKDRNDVAAIQAAIDSASPGDTVLFPAGTYRLDSRFIFKSGVNYVGDPKTPPILLGVTPVAVSFTQNPDSPLRDATIRGLIFDNVVLRFQGTSHSGSFANVTIEDCEFRNGRSAEPWNSDYIWLAYTDGFTIEDCTFLRDSASAGRGIVLERTRSTVVKDSYFGTTRKLEDNVPNGWFKTAINLTGYENDDERNVDVVIDGNVWRRTPGIRCAYDNVSICEDHGLYAWGVRGLVIVGNRADGWTDSGSGGSVKLRNSDDVLIARNHFRVSGVLTHTYWHTDPTRFTRVRVEENRIDLAGRSGQAIGYWRSTDTGSSREDLCQRRDGGERELYITRNRMVSGGAITVQCATGSQICVSGNVNATLELKTPGVRRRGCEDARTWTMPLPGVYRGDFNGDGKADFAQAVTGSDGNLHWRAHVSAGDGFTVADWGGGITPIRDAQRYGVQVGDFTGDGLDDIVYRSSCGDKECWRLHASTGGAFAEGRVLGSPGGWFSAETFSFGVRTGDFNGDKLADLLYRGRCGQDGHACWLVLASQADGRAVAQDWGDRAQWAAGVTLDYGLFVGDFNGDGRSDVAYLGGCASGQCFRVHVSTGKTFEPQDWGYSFRPDSTTGHFGITVADRNHDGATDLIYRGACAGTRRWGYLLGTEQGGPFTADCRAS